MVFIRKTKWYLLIENEELGPFTFDQLKKRRDITPFTLVRKKGEKEWVVVAKVYELRHLFNREKRGTYQEKEPVKEVLILPSQRFSYFLWLLLLIFIIIYLLIGFYARF